MQGVFAPVGNLGVNVFGTLFLSGALCNGQLGFQITVKTPGFQLGAVRAGGGIFQPKVDADPVLASWDIRFNLNRDIEVPATTGILVERG